MHRLASSLLIIALAVTIPARASHVVAKSDKSADAVATKPAKVKDHKPILPALPTIVARAQTSSKGTRVVAFTVLPNATKPIAKKAAVKAVAAPVVATSPTPANGGPMTANSSVPAAQTRLARITCYYTEEDQWTAKHESSTGARLQEGFCAVDPKLIPYGSLVQIPGGKSYMAVDTGSAVISRQAAIGSAETAEQRNALVIDLFFENRRDAMNFAAHGPAFATISWSKPVASADSPNNPRALPMGVPKLPAGAVYMLAEAPSMADTRMPLIFRPPQM